MFGDLWFEDCVKIEQDIWFAAGNYNGLYRFNTISGEIRRVVDFPGEPLSKSWTFRRIGLWNSKLVFMPAFANAVYLFDTKRESFEIYNILNAIELSEYEGKCKFQCFEIFGDWLYIVGYEYCGIIKVNLRNRQVEKLANIPNVVLEKDKNVESFFGNEVIVENSIMYLTCPSSNKILMLDTDTDCFEIMEVGSSKNGYNGIYKIDSIYYLVVFGNDNIVCWDRKKGRCTEIKLEFNTYFWDRKVCETKKYIWFFSYVTNEVYRMDKRNQNVSKIVLNHSDSAIWLVYCKETPDGIYFLNRYSGEWHFLREDGTDESLNFVMKDSGSVELLKRLLQDNKYENWEVVCENDIVPLKLLFIKVFGLDGKSVNDSSDFCCGRLIYESIENKGN